MGPSLGAFKSFQELSLVICEKERFELQAECGGPF